MVNVMIIVKLSGIWKQSLYKYIFIYSLTLLDLLLRGGEQSRYFPKFSESDLFSPHTKLSEDEYSRTPALPQVCLVSEKSTYVFRLHRNLF